MELTKLDVLESESMCFIYHCSEKVTFWLFFLYSTKKIFFFFVESASWADSGYTILRFLEQKGLTIQILSNSTGRQTTIRNRIHQGRTGGTQNPPNEGLFKISPLDSDIRCIVQRDFSREKLQNAWYDDVIKLLWGTRREKSNHTDYKKQSNATSPLFLVDAIIFLKSHRLKNWKNSRIG